MNESEQVIAWKDCKGNLHEDKETADAVNALEGFKEWYNTEDNAIWCSNSGDVDAEEVLEWIIVNKTVLKKIIG